MFLTSKIHNIDFWSKITLNFTIYFYATKKYNDKNYLSLSVI